jgi:hypothetical protein
MATWKNVTNVTFDEIQVGASADLTRSLSQTVTGLPFRRLSVPPQGQYPPATSGERPRATWRPH